MKGALLANLQENPISHDMQTIGAFNNKLAGPGASSHFSLGQDVHVFSALIGFCGIFNDDFPNKKTYPVVKHLNLFVQVLHKSSIRLPVYQI